MTPPNKSDLMQLRRVLIGTLKSVEDALDLPADKRAVRSRVDKGRTNKLKYSKQIK